MIHSIPTFHDAQDRGCATHNCSLHDLTMICFHATICRQTFCRLV